MAWFQIRFQADAAQVDTLEELLLEQGALAVTLEDAADQPILEPELGTMPVWDKTQVVGLFDAKLNSQTVVEQLAQQYKQALPTHKIEIVEDKDWTRAWMEDYHPMPFGKRLWVCPSWREPPVKNAVNLLLDPGLAFGTGTHPTTSLCLKYLDKEVVGDELIVDFGCGSGVLGIAALLLGAKQMVGIDIDPQALTATKDNAQRNNISADKYQVFLPKDTPAVEADITVANILAGPLVTLGEQIAALTRSGGKLALSGLLAEQADEVIAHYSQWFKMNAPEQQGDWIILSGIKF